jgi:hypothetical protein
MDKQADWIKNQRCILNAREEMKAGYFVAGV